MSEQQLLTISEVVQKVGMCKTWIYAAVASGDFPAPRKIGPKAVRWVASEIDRWIESLPAATPH